MNLFNIIHTKAIQAFAACGFQDAAPLTRLSDRPDIGDYQINGALALAKTLEQNPRALAEKIAGRLRQDSFFETVSVDGPGFINLRLADTALTAQAFEILATPAGGYARPDAPLKIVIDYGGPNVAKALHVGHLRSAVIGESVKRICRFAGDTVIGDIHLGDWGRPLGLVITEIQERWPDLPYFDSAYQGGYPAEIPLTGADLEVIYPLASKKAKENPDYDERTRENVRKLQAGERGIRALWGHIMRLSAQEMKKIYDELGVSFDLWNGESTVHNRLQAMIQRLKNDGTIVHDAGAEIISLGKSQNGNDLPPLIMLKSDGSVMYGATDLATIEDRIETDAPNAILYVADTRQALHFEQVFTAARKIGLVPPTRLEFLGLGTVNGKDNKPYKTRDGGVASLRFLIDTATAVALKKMRSGEIGRELTPAEQDAISKIVGVAAVKFADLMNERGKNYIFDEEKLTSTDGKTGPYILYALVRMKSVLEKLGAAETPAPQDAVAITHPAERQLLLRLYAFPDSVQTAYDNRTPHVLCDYLFKLAQDFNLFYHDCPIKDSESAVQASRLALTKYTLQLARTTCSLLGLQVPPKM